MLPFLPYLIIASKTTLTLSLSALALGMLLTILITALHYMRWKLVNYIVDSFLFLIRSLPEMLVLLIFYFVPTQLLLLITHRYINFSAFTYAIVALSMIFTAYATQILQGALNAIDSGQYEAAFTLGFNKWDTFNCIILPQAWRYALPGLGNQWLILLKDSALVSLIGVNDLMRQTQIAGIAMAQKFTYLLIAAFIYLLLTLVSQFILAKLNYWLTYFEREKV